MRRIRGQGKPYRRQNIPKRVGIKERLEVVNERARFADWEGDTSVGVNQNGYPLTFAKRMLLICISVPSSGIVMNGTRRLTFGVWDAGTRMRR